MSNAIDGLLASEAYADLRPHITNIRELYVTTYPASIINKIEEETLKKTGDFTLIDALEVNKRLSSFFQCFSEVVTSNVMESLNFVDPDKQKAFLGLLFDEYELYKEGIHTQSKIYCPAKQQEKNLDRLEKKIAELKALYKELFPQKSVNFWNLQDGLQSLLNENSEDAEAKAVRNIFDIDLNIDFTNMMTAVITDEEQQNNLISMLSGLEKICQSAKGKPYIPRFDSRKIAIQKWVDGILDFLMGELSLKGTLPQYTKGKYHSASPVFESLVLLSRQLPSPPTERAIFEAMVRYKQFVPGKKIIPGGYAQKPHEALQWDSSFYRNQVNRSLGH